MGAVAAAAGGDTLHRLLDLVDRCEGPRCLPVLRALHSRLLLLTSLSSSPISVAKLLRSYSHCGALHYAAALFFSTHPLLLNVIHFNILLRAYVARGSYSDALRLFSSMGLHRPDHYTYPCALKACGGARDVVTGRQVHASAVALGLVRNSFVANGLISMYCRCGVPGDASKVFDEMSHRDVVSWNAMIAGLACGGEYEKALDLCRDMVMDGTVLPDDGTMASIFPAMKNAKGKDILFVRGMFDNMRKEGVVSWNAMIAVYANSSIPVEAVEVFKRMAKSGVEPDEVTLASVLPACGEAPALWLGKQIHEIIRRKKMCPNLLLENALLAMYAQCGCLKDAREVFDSMSIKDVVSWTTVMSAYGMHGRGREAIELFERMRGDGLEPDSIAFVSVLAACSHAGLLDDGIHYFDIMRSSYHITPTYEHYTCMVDLFGRTGRIAEAHDFILQMPIEPNERVWGALLSACRAHSDMVVGPVVADKLLALVPKQSGYYVLLSNLYARAGRFDGVASVRNVMASKGIKKLPGRSDVELGDRVYRFYTGDQYHVQSKAIYEKLDELMRKIKDMGYVPDTASTLHDVEEEDRERHLSVHSEKLAIAYVLLNTDAAGTPIRITMNLRMCGDCHCAVKLISRLTGREILVKDNNRFHHIVDGICSCGDYW